MSYSTIVNLRMRSVLPPALFFAYVLSIVFEGAAFYNLADYYSVDPTRLVLAAGVSMFLGLLGGSLAVKSGQVAKRVMLFGEVMCLCLSCVFFFKPSTLWMIAIAFSALVAGASMASWGHFLKSHTPRGQRIKSCADVLIIANVFLIIINSLSGYISPFVGLSVAMTLIVAAIICTAMLETDPYSNDEKAVPESPAVSVVAPLAALVIFVTIITINSGLMYQIIVPAYDHLTFLTSWYWALPYVAALLIMRNLSSGRALSLYVGMAMIVGAFIFFLLLDKGAASYLVVDTLMLGACGIFDLFWWSMLGEMLDLSKRPARVFGIGLAANVFGILIGKTLAFITEALMLPASSITIVALTVVCVTLMLLPVLNHRLSVLLKNHSYLSAFSAIPTVEQRELLTDMPSVEPLTPREYDVLMRALGGKTNKSIAADLMISENTVKTHLRNIFRKYEVSSRSELISIFIKTPLG